jgi:hypothetical protein
VGSGLLGSQIRLLTASLQHYCYYDGDFIGYTVFALYVTSKTFLLFMVAQSSLKKIYFNVFESVPVYVRKAQQKNDSSSWSSVSPSLPHSPSLIWLVYSLEISSRVRKYSISAFN